MLRRHLLALPLAAAVAIPSVAAAAPLHPQPSATTSSPANAASTKKAHAAVKLPIVTSISPRHILLGQTLTIRGHHFRAGKRKNTVVLHRSGVRAVFVPVGNATTSVMRVVLPMTLRPFLSKKNGALQPTLFRMRILSRRFAAHFTKPSRSPVIGLAAGDGGGTTPTPAVPACDPTGHGLAPSGDADKDLLNNALEVRIGTDPCRADSDSDGITDGYEYTAALDYNSQALPYPGKRPYPNALDPTDANVDHDGDGLTLMDEYTAWVKYGHHTLSPLVLSDGTQNSGGPVATPVGALAYLDLNGNGVLTDDERDIDGDGLSNWVEQYGPGNPSWWTVAYANEAYGLSRFARTDWLDSDTDGDGLPDGADDIDHDGYTNVQEEQGPTARNRIYNAQGFIYSVKNASRVATAYYDGGLWVNPFNPCLPAWHQSPTCSLHPPFGGGWEPFFTNPVEPTPLMWPRCDLDATLPAPQASRPLAPACVAPPAGP